MESKLEFFRPHELAPGGDFARWDLWYDPAFFDPEFYDPIAAEGKPVGPHVHVLVKGRAVKRMQQSKRWHA